jgi:hypothetical protein
MENQPLFNVGFLAAQLETEYQEYLASGADDRTRSHLQAWAKQRADSALDNHLVELDARLDVGAVVTVENTDDELRLLINGVRVVELYDQPHTPFIAAQWRQFARTTNITESFDGKRLLKALTTLRATADTNLRTAVVNLDKEIQALDTEIAAAESAINTDIYNLYGLTNDEIALVEKG